MRKTALLIALCAVAALAAGEEELQKAEKAWVAAVVKRDYAALDRVLDAGLIYAHSTGAIESKGEYLSRMRSGAQRYDGIEHKSMTVRLHGDAAAVHSKVRMTGTSNGKPFDNQLMMMHLWVKQGGQWRLAAHQTTSLE
jgi:ketosteroid isomerase-like protein